jgi:hypothetical protein
MPRDVDRHRALGGLLYNIQLLFDSQRSAQGIMAGAAKAVSLGSHPLAPQGMPTKPALTGISDGAKKSIAVINTVLTTLRVFIGSPRQQAKLALVGGTTYDISATVETNSLYL